MVVKTECYGCGNEYPLGARTPPDDGMDVKTACPGCGSASYRSFTEGVDDSASDFELIKQAISVSGVGSQTAKNIHDEYNYFSVLAEADLDELTDVDGVGEGNGSRILEQIERMTEDY